MTYFHLISFDEYFWRRKIQLKTKWVMKICIFRGTQIFSSNYNVSFFISHIGNNRSFELDSHKINSRHLNIQICPSWISDIDFFTLAPRNDLYLQFIPPPPLKMADIFYGRSHTVAWTDLVLFHTGYLTWKMENISTARFYLYS